MNRYLFLGLLGLLVVVLYAPFATAAEIMHLTFENGADLAEDSSGAGLVSGSVTSVNFFGTLNQSSDTHSGGGSNSAEFVPFLSADPNISPDGGEIVEFRGAGMPDFSVADDFTFSLWLKPTNDFINDVDSDSGFRGIASGLVDSGTTGEWQLDNGASFDPNDPNSATPSRLNAVSSPNVELIPGGDLDPNQWTQVAISYIGRARIALVSVGDESTSLTINGASSGATGLAFDELLLGQNRAGGSTPVNRFYEGLMDDVRLFDTGIIYDGAGGEFEYGDLNLDGIVLDPNDWAAFRDNMGADLSAETVLGAYSKGDIDFDGDNDIDDFLAFKDFYNEVNGLGALEALISVPEPGTMLLSFTSILAALGLIRRKPALFEFESSRRHSSGKAITTMKHASFALFCAIALLISSNNTLRADVVFSADFEGGLVQADTGTLTITNSVTSIVGVTDSADPNETDWETGALFADRTASGGGDPGLNMVWDFTDPVSLTGATITFDHAIRRFNTPNTKSHTITAYDSLDSVLFSVSLIDRIDGGLENIADYVTSPETDERQRQTVTYIDPINGNSLFAASQIASGAIPDSNDRSGGSNSFTGFFGADNTDDANADESDAGSFSITTTATGWTLSAKAAPAPNPGAGGSLSDFTTVEIPYSSNVLDLARIEVDGATVQAGGFWDNLSVDGTIVVPQQPLTLQIASDGQMTLRNPSSLALDIDYISISSADVELNGGSLDPNGFTGIGGDPNFPQGNGTGNGWELSGSNTDTSIIEAYLTGSSIIDPNDVASLGAGFIPGSTEDLEFTYHIVGEPITRTGVVEYAAGLAGDFDGNGRVDGLDFLEWQRNPSIGDLADWQANYGMSLLSELSEPVPEPGTLVLCLATLGLLLNTRRFT